MFLNFRNFSLNFINNEWISDEIETLGGAPYTPYILTFDLSDHLVEPGHDFRITARKQSDTNEEVPFYFAFTGNINGKFIVWTDSPGMVEIPITSSFKPKLTFALYFAPLYFSDGEGVGSNVKFKLQIIEQ